jgi:hypothetical protein
MKFKFLILCILISNLISCNLLTPKKNKIEFKAFSICFESLKDYESNFTKNLLKVNDFVFLNTYFSPRSISISHDIGIEKDLIRYIKLLQKGGTRKEINKLSKKIYDLINLSNIELSSMLAIADCERDRAMQFASYLDNIKTDQLTLLSIKSLLFTVAGTSLTAIFELLGATNSVYLGVDVLFAGIAGYFAYSALELEVKANYNHERNLLREIMEKPENPKYYYRTVWNFLVDENYPGEVSERETILELWELDKLTNEEREIFFSDGGPYNSDMMYKRVRMIDTLKTRISYMKLELKLLYEDLNKLESEFLFIEN